MPIVDVHTHMFTRRWLELLRSAGSPYHVVVRPDGRDEIYRGETPVVFPQPGHFDYGIRIAEMDRAGIDVSIVSLTCPNVYWGGEALPCLVGRFEKGDEVELPARRRMTLKPTEYLRRLWYDCITYDLGALRYLISVVGPDRVLFGTDWPHQVHDVYGSIANTGA